MPLWRRILVGGSDSSDTFPRDCLLLFHQLAELREGGRFVVPLLLLQFVDESHLLINLLEEVLDMPVYVIDVPSDLGLDVLRPVCITQGVLRLVEVHARRADAYDHDGLAVSPQRKFEQS